MKIANVTPGLIPIPPNGWGAIEKIIWEIHQNLLLLGHDSKILYADDINRNEFDIVHVHVANLANLLYERGIPYIFSVHDHHAYLYGKDSSVFKENLKAIENSMITLVPAKYLVEYFNSPKVRYFKHGVNNSIFKPSNNLPSQTHKLLCVANNGWAYDQSADRKGFGIAIQVASDLGLDLTIAGPSNNKNYFNSSPSDYRNLKIVYDLTEDELIKTYQEHSIFLHPSILEAGHPNLTLLEALSCGLPVVGTYENDNELPGLEKVERDVESFKIGVKKVIQNFEKYRKEALEISQKLSWKNRTLDLIKIYNSYTSKKEMRELLIHHYENTPIFHIDPKKPKNSIYHSYIGGPKVEILGSVSNKYKIEFIDSKNGFVHHTSEITNGMWTSCSIKYCLDWKIVVTPEDPIEEQTILEFNPTSKRVYISLDSKSLGDTLAWFPIVEEFRKKWNCDVICSTFRNEFFEKTYPQIEFVSPGSLVDNLYAMFNIGWYYFSDGSQDFSKVPQDFRSIPLQQTASDILNVPYIKTIAPVLDKSKIERRIEGKYVCIAPHASALAKYWNRPGGWQAVIDHLNGKGYKVVYISQEPLEDAWHDSKLGGTLKNVMDLSGDLPISERFNDLCFADYFIGVGSGLSWLSWSAGTPTMLISGFSKPYTEFEENCDRIFHDDVCNGCFNTHKLDAGDWWWCPIHKGTDRQFECTKTITEDEIIKVLDSRL